MTSPAENRTKPEVLEALALPQGASSTVAPAFVEKVRIDHKRATFALVFSNGTTLCGKLDELEVFVP